MNKLEQHLLLEIADRLTTLRSLPEPTWESVGGDPAHARQIWHDAQAGVIPNDLEGFLGRLPSQSERVLASRALKELERLGYIVRLSSQWSSRTRRIGLTPAGAAAAHTLPPIPTTRESSDSRPLPEEPNAPPAAGGGNG